MNDHLCINFNKTAILTKKTFKQNGTEHPEWGMINYFFNYFWDYSTDSTDHTVVAMLLTNLSQFNGICSRCNY